jgi:SNF2 family DNA or RNA helicase
MNACIFCSNCDKESANADKEMDCKLLNIKVTALRCCPGFKPIEQTAEDIADKERLLALSSGHSQVQIKAKSVSRPKVSKASSVSKDIDYDQVKVKLFDHQIKAREKFRHMNDIALFFEMGCGKTLTSMMIICDKFKDGIIDSLLVVAPNDVHKQWFDDLCNDESTLSKAIEQEGVKCDGQIIGGRGGQKEFYDFDYDTDKLHIVVTNIDTFSTPHKWEVIVDWANNHKTAIIVDEATVIKNPTSKRAERMLYEFNDVTKVRKTIKSNVKKPNTQVRIVLTGTPVTNGPMDLWSIMEFVKPNFFNRNYYSFMNYYGMHTQLNVDYEMNGVAKTRTIQVLLTEKTWQAIHNCDSYMEAFAIMGCSEDTYMTIKHQSRYMGPYKHAEELKVMLEPNAVFAKLVDCVDMPSCNYLVRTPAMSDAQKAAYQSMLNDMLAQYGDYITMAKNRMTVSMRLQQISSGFIMGHDQEQDVHSDDDPFWAEDQDITPDQVVWLGDSNPKLEMLLRDVDELDKPLLIITRFSAEAAKIYDLLKDKYNVCLFTGWKTVGSLEKFKAGEHDIVVANIAKISRGHNLQCAHTTLYYSNTFSMEHRQQSEFRTFRIGQKHPCTYVDYVSCPVDQTILDSLKMKKGLLEYIRDKDVKELF